MKGLTLCEVSLVYLSCCLVVDFMTTEVSVDSDDFDHAMHMLFTARWNIPKAAAHIGRPSSVESWEETKLDFRKYCAQHTI